MAGAKETAATRAQIEGRSLVPLSADPKAEWAERTLFTHLGRWPTGAMIENHKYGGCAVRTPRWHLVSNDKGLEKQWQPFDVKADPGERIDAAAKHPAVVPKVNPFGELYEKQFGERKE